MKTDEKEITCRLCQAKASKAFQTKVLNKYDVNYYQCSNCLLLQSEKPFWIEEAYQDAISILDTGIFFRNIENVKKLTVLLSSLKFITSSLPKKFSFFKKDSWYPTKNEDSILDFGGGHGILVRLLRDVGFDAYWYDKYATNHFSKGFESSNKKYQVTLAFELFEHFDEPKKNISEILESKNPDILIFSTLLYGESVPSFDWWYYSFQGGQHIAFYNKKTFKEIEKIFQCKIYSITDDFHILIKNEMLFDEKKLFQIFENIEIKFEEAKSLYSTKTFEDHLYIKKMLETI